MDAISAAMKIAGSGLEAQSLRVRMVSENIANANSLGSAPGADPYRRKTIVFQPEFDRALGADTVTVKKIGVDPGEFTLSYDPSHPAADQKGYVKVPNVNTLIEMTDMREATRSYDANLNVIEQARGMAMATLALLDN
ncbi:flagellar basal body rod protein FlgC [Parvularcula sp. ZS-1/3]|uniref:Flagellar basal-body rod protein FlgC n=1 Tax=Parvularcula mediterranea TaxID=2732508 RepID=A0A7Y3W628_9PROT|nr:flagellar basal body rod protein FlgC [Parvularcula mediterranea]NNU17405.1 flagellar basal body rod protein FlgC [Parvularcula mediterranea]